jgi:3-hydroxyisobutyrate dehydrogenase
MLPNYKIVGEVLEKDLFLNAPKNSLFIDCSTISPLEAQVLHKVSVEKGHKFVDAPVSGGVKAARDAKLTFMVGTGSQPLFEEVKEVLKFMGANVIMTGANSAGQIAKACNNMALAIEMIGISEAMNLGK